MKKLRLNILYFICMILLLIVCTVKLFSLFISPLTEETILLGGVWAFLALASFIGALFSFRKKQEEHIKRNFGQVFALKSDSYHVSRQRKKRSVIKLEVVATRTNTHRYRGTHPALCRSSWRPCFCIVFYE